MIIRWYRLLAPVLIVLAAWGAIEIPRRNLKSTAQVAGIALDWEEENIKTTFELYEPSEEENFGQKRKIIVSRGKTLQQCIDQAKILSGKELFVSDAAALIISNDHHSALLSVVFEYYKELKNDHMDLPVFFAFGQPADAIFKGEGAVVSDDLVSSARQSKQVQTVKNLMNGVGERVLIKGEGDYEIIS